ncbi:MAG: zinc-ribbon and DUF3426 domain-containing protein [Variovorax sp.]
MSLVTRCPACATAFKVVRDQLRISDGWVRCGRCSHVFDATVDLHEAPEAAPVPSKDEPTLDIEESDFLDDDPESRPAELEFTPEVEVEVDVEDEAEAEAEAEAENQPEASRNAEPQRLASVFPDEPWQEWEQPAVSAETDVVPPYPSLPPFPNIDLTLRTPPSAPQKAPAEAADSGNAQLQKALRRARAKHAKIAKAKAREEERAAGRESAPVVLAASESELSAAADAARRGSGPLGPPAERQPFWRRMLAWRSTRIITLLAAVLLIAQVLRQERDVIVARQPALRPALAALCELTGCELSALRRIGDITIDGASFARDKTGDAYRLSFTLRNAAAVPLAMPAVELSLLDTQERAVVRRVLLPAEFGAPSVLPARAERGASLPLALASPEAAALPPVAGYRVLAFYP